MSSTPEVFKFPIENSDKLAKLTRLVRQGMKWWKKNWEWSYRIRCGMQDLDDSSSWRGGLLMHYWWSIRRWTSCWKCSCPAKVRKTPDWYGYGHSVRCNNIERESPACFSTRGKNFTQNPCLFNSIKYSRGQTPLKIYQTHNKLGIHLVSRRVWINVISID